MKKSLHLLIALLLVASTGFGQIAPDFTATDCSSNSHNLYADLNSGKTVVLTWTMPCLTCIAPIRTAYSIAKSYEAKPGNTGKIVFYLIDDFGDQDCTYLTNWASNNNIGPNLLSVIQNAPSGTIVKEDDFGGYGMPHITIVSGTDHKIVYDVRNNGASDAAGFEYALFKALQPVSVSTTASATKTVLYPNPASTTVNIEYNAIAKTEVRFDVINVVGEKVLSTIQTANAGKNVATLNTSELTSGIYYVKMYIGDQTEIMKFNIVK